LRLSSLRVGEFVVRNTPCDAISTPYIF
jgi:hypothetical protein